MTVLADSIDDVLGKVVKGAGFILIGTVIGLAVSFVAKIVIIRYITQSQYGIYQQAITVISIFTTVAGLGLRGGVTRQISYYREKNKSKVGSLIGSSLTLGLISSVLVSICIYIFADPIAQGFFNEPDLVLPLKLVSFSLPLVLLGGILVSILRGFENPKGKVLFKNLTTNITRLAGFGVVILLALSFLGVLSVYLISCLLGLLVVGLYTKSKIPSEIGVDIDFSVAKKLIIFSIPLMGAGILATIMNWTDTLIIGFYEVSANVGLYRGAYPLARLIPTLLTAAGFLYMPLISKLEAAETREKINRAYQVVTKWIFSGAFPIFLLLFLFPETILKFFFGAEYIPASLPLRILSLGFMVHAFLGLNGTSLVAIGKTKQNFYGRMVGAASNIVLNILLIPFIGITGAAIASTSSYITINVYLSLKLYQTTGIHPFLEDYIKPVLGSIFLLAIIYLFTTIINIKFWMLPIILLIYLLGYLFLLLLTGSFSEEDINMLVKIDEKIGIDLTTLKEFLKKVVR
ncbi:hypothetical protein AKJ57_04790 [candidate division MSBL1 archaeon SCGC-AAA259A05]|uniref:Uncharacterized protein n=1 Tax=candidate division MSBL1 archaeon SCGC-AAA259A05 TaxID=1698259 RepID=A0A133U6Q3_9EURY|nr:hypothetical protein AKJ57_04790 [candidate division MSBL1 archaeon SCGC-AAA259A05]